MTITDVQEETPGAATDRQAWSRLIAIFGLVMVALGAFITAVAQEIIPPVVIIALLYLVIAGLVKFKPGKAGPIMGIVVSVLLVLVSATSAPASLAHPESALDWITTAVQVAVPLATIIAAVAYLRNWAPGPAKGLSLATAVILVVGSVVSIGAALAVEDDESLPGDEKLTAKEVEFRPEEIRVAAGTVAFFIDNRDPIRHTFKVEAIDVDQELPAHTSRRVEFQAAPGVYEYFCSVEGHEDMKGTLVVEG